VRWIAVDAVLGAASGAFFGFAFGAFGLLLNADSWSIVSVASYFALCGAAAGAVVGACGAVLEGDGVSDPARLSSQATAPRTALVLLDRDITAPNQQSGHQSNRRVPHNRLVNVVKQGHETSRKPSRN
jgi:hypothetical protein